MILDPLDGRSELGPDLINDRWPPANPLHLQLQVVDLALELRGIPGARLEFAQQPLDPLLQLDQQLAVLPAFRIHIRHKLRKLVDLHPLSVADGIIAPNEH
ncbi:MAG: hypothetical protein IPO29_19130 [Anaerolineae bacterium]|nr:hypothetical protein [Anaerolineae bacterium]